MQEFSITISPRLYETDAMGHINNATIAAWFEVVRVRFMESLDSTAASIGQDWILASVHIDYVAETFYGEDVTAKIVGTTVGNSSVTFETAMFQGGRQTVKGRAVLVHLDYASKTTKRVPDDLRAELAALG